MIDVQFQNELSRVLKGLVFHFEMGPQYLAVVHPNGKVVFTDGANLGLLVSRLGPNGERQRYMNRCPMTVEAIAEEVFSAQP